MKTAVCYFTGTGNSLYAAQRVAEQLPGCDFFRMLDVFNHIEVLEQYQRIGLFFPVYGFGLPRMVKDLVRQLEQEHSDRIFFAILTCGAMSGDCEKQLFTLMSENGLNLNYVNTVKMPDNFTLLFPAPSPRMVEATLQIADRRLAVMGADIRSNLERRPRFGWQPMQMAHRVFMSDGESRDKNFILTAACNGCGECAKLCPAGNIVMKEGRPDFQHRCQFCLGCFHRCPQGAINYGRKTIRKKRYVNPKVDFIP